jgi:hypothetical protein
MSLPALSVLSGEIISPEESIHVSGKTHPLAGDRIQREVAVGLSIREILAEVLPGGSRYDLMVAIDGHVIARDNWARVRPKRGTTVTFIPQLHGGGVRTALSLVAVVAALIIAPYIGPGIASAFAAAGITVSAQVAAAIAASAIITGAVCALNSNFLQINCQKRGACPVGNISAS